MQHSYEIIEDGKSLSHRNHAFNAPHAERKTAAPEIGTLRPKRILEMSSFSPLVQEAIRKMTKDILKEYGLNRITARQAAKIFEMPKELVTRRHVAYYKAYAELAVTQLIIGAYFGPNGGYAHGSEKTQLDALKNHASDLIFTGSAIFHDITHSFIALALSDDPKSLTALIPDFQKLPSGREAYASEDEYYYAHGQLVSDEILVFSFDGTQSRTSMLLAIQSMPEDEFIRCFSSHSRDPKRRALAARLLGRLYRELPKNPTIFFDIFADVTMPLMQTHAPKEAAAFANETESIRLAA